MSLIFFERKGLEMIKQIVLTLALALAAAPVYAQTVTEKAKKEIAADKEKAKVSEAKRLIKESEGADHRIAELNKRKEAIAKRLKALDGGAEPEEQEGLTPFGSYNCIGTYGRAVPCP
jgi:hypothetical protein